MSFASLLNEDLVIERFALGPEDDYGAPSQTYVPFATVRGRVRPKNVTEVALLSQAGATISDYTIYLEPTDVTEADHIKTADPTDRRVFEIDGVRDAAGQHHHLELDAHVISPDEEEEAEGS